MSYLNGGVGSGKTTPAIELFHVRKPLVFTPTHRLVKEMRKQGVEAQTYHSFFRWSGQIEWTSDSMGQKYIPRVIICDEVCTVPKPILETFLGWLKHRGIQVICCGDQGQPPPIAGEMLHDSLRAQADYYEEIEVNHRAKDPVLKALKKAIRLQTDKIQCREMRKVVPGCLGWGRFVWAWKPDDLILTSNRKSVKECRSCYSSIIRTTFQTHLYPSCTTPRTAGSRTYKSPSRAQIGRKSWYSTTLWMSASRQQRQPSGLMTGT